MLGRSVGIAAVCALGASAFIIPAGIAPASDSEALDLSISAVNPKSRTIFLPCSECAFSTGQKDTEDVEEKDDSIWIQGGANSLVLNFTVSDDGQRLQLNDEHIYPPRFQQGSWLEEPIYVKQVSSQATLADIRSGEVRSADLEITAYGVDEAEKEALSPNGDMLVPVRFGIMGLEHEFMAIDEVNIKLLQTGDGELLIMEVESVPGDHPMFEVSSFPPGPDRLPEDMDHPPPPHHGAPHNDEPQECNMLPEPLCRLKAQIESKINKAMGHRGGFRKMGGCPGRKGPHGSKLPGHIKPHFNRPGPDDHPDSDDHPKQHHGRPHHMRPHGQHHAHHGHHGFFGHHFLHSFAQGLVAVLIPVMAGITVGMTVSLLGLAVGRLIAFVWIKFARGGRRGYASAAQQEVLVEEGENKPMIAEMEAPPVYEDSPAYEVAEKE